MTPGYPEPYPAEPFRAKFRFAWIDESWRLFQSQAGTWIVSAFLFLLIVLGARIALAMILGIPVVVTLPNGGWITNRQVFEFGFFMGGKDFHGLLLDGVSVVLVSYLSTGLYLMANTQVRGYSLEPGFLFQGYKAFASMIVYILILVLAYFAVSIPIALVTQLMVVAGVLLAIVAALLIEALFWPGFALIADRVPLGQAIGKSVKAAVSDLGMGALLALVFELILIISAIPCGLGLLVTLPMLCLTGSLMYRDMIGMPMPAVAADPHAQPVYGAPVPGVWPPPPGSPASQYPGAPQTPLAGWRGEPTASAPQGDGGDIVPLAGPPDAPAGGESSEPGTSNPPGTV